MSADEQQPADDPYAGPSPYDTDTPSDRILAALLKRPKDHRRPNPDPENVSRPDLQVPSRIASLKKAGERRARNPVLVRDSDELGHDDVDFFAHGGGRFVPPSAYRHRGATGIVVLVERHTPSLVFLTPDRFPIRASLSYPSAGQLSSRVGAAVGNESRNGTGPPIDDPRWRGIGVAGHDDAVRIRLHTDHFDVMISLEADDARRLVDVLEDVLDNGRR